MIKRFPAKVYQSGISPEDRAAFLEKGRVLVGQVEELSGAGAGTIDLTGFSEEYSDYVIMGRDIQAASNNYQLRARLSINSDSNWISSNRYNSQYLWIAPNSNDYRSQGDLNAVQFEIANNSSLWGDAHATDIDIFIPGALDDKHPRLWWDAIHSTGHSRISGGGYLEMADAAIRGIRFYMSSGNINGKFRLYGLTN